MRTLRSSEGLRLALAVVLAAGVAVLIESLVKGGGHHAHAAGSQSSVAAAESPGSAGASHASGGRGTPGHVVGATVAPGVESASGASASAEQSASQAAHVTVASGPAVAHSLRHGWVNIVIDQPPAGLLSDQNASITQGATVAAAEVNSARGLPHHVRVKLIPQDLDQLSASAAAARLRSEGAAAVILPCDTDSQLNLAAELGQERVLMLAPCNPEPATGERYPTYWPVGMSASEEATGLAHYMRAVGNPSAFVVSSSGTRYVDLLTGDFRSAAQSAGVRLVGGASVAMSGTNYASLARTIDATNPRPAAIFTAFPPPFVNRLAAGLRAQGVSQYVLGTTAMDTPLTLSSGSGALENAVFASYGFPREDASARRFAAAYQRRFGRSPIGSFPGLGAETIRLLEDAAGKAGSAEPNAIQHALARGITLRGVALADRSYQVGGDHSPTGQVSISKVASGGFLPLLASSTSELSNP